MRMAGLIEKPDHEQSALLVAECGITNLRLLQGRMRVTLRLLRYLAVAAGKLGIEPKLSLALASYSESHCVDVVTSTQTFTDLGLSNTGRALATRFRRPTMPALG